MNYTENFEGIKVDVQAVDITIGDELQERVRDMLVKLRRHISEINWVDVYFTIERGQSTNTKSVRVRLGIPGTDVFASDTGEDWLPLMKSVEEKLRKQLEKR
jgi:ribosomal subunit interface protein